jgi:hypothetical protein
MICKKKNTSTVVGLQHLKQSLLLLLCVATIYFHFFSFSFLLYLPSYSIFQSGFSYFTLNTERCGAASARETRLCLQSPLWTCSCSPCPSASSTRCLLYVLLLVIGKLHWIHYITKNTRVSEIIMYIKLLEQKIGGWNIHYLLDVYVFIEMMIR